jgi:hypothetical protein
MGRSVVITTPLLTADEMATRLGIGKKRLAAIKEIVRKPYSVSGRRRATGSSGGKAEKREKAAS